MAENTISLKVLLEADTANMKLGQLEDHFAQLQERIRQVPRGSKAFNDLSHSIAKTSAEIKNIELGFEGLDREGVASQLGGLAGGIGEVTASLVLMGGENETMQEMAAGIEKAMAISMGFKGAIEGLSAASKLYNNLLKQGKVQVMAKAAVEKVAALGTWMLNAANKALNTTMKMNPIGLVVTALAAVVGGIIYFKDEIWSLIKTALKPLQFAIDAVVDALQWLGIMESDSAIATREAEEEKAKAAVDSAKKRNEAARELRRVHKETTEAIVKDIDFEIRKRTIAGEDFAELSRKKIELLKEVAEEESKAAEQNRMALEQTMKTMGSFGKFYEELYDETTETAKKAAEEARKLSEDLTAHDLEQEKKRKDEREKASAERKKQREKDKAADEKAAADQKKIDEKAAADAIKLEKEKNQLLEDLEAKAIEDKTTRSLAELEIAQERERQQLVEKYGLDTELMLALEEEQLLQMNTLIEGIEQEARDKKAEADKEALDKELENIETARQAKIEAAQASMDLALTTLNAISDVSNTRADEEVKKEEERFNKLRATKQLTEKQIAAEEAITAAAKDAIRKKQFENDKKMQIAMAAINGAQALTSIFAQYPKFDGGFAMVAAMASSVITTAATIAKIKATTFTSTPAPALPALKTEDSDDSPTGPDAGDGVQLSPVTNTSTILGNQKIFVTETDITNTQNNVSVIEESATF